MRIREEYRIALAVCPTPLMIVSRDGKIILSNRRVDALFGYDAGELCHQPVDILVPEEARSVHPEVRDAFFEVPTSRGMGTGRDLFGVRKNGELIPVEIGLEPIEQDGQSLVMVSVLDIRQRKLDESKTRRAIDAASSAMVMINEQGKIELVNKQTRHLFGYEASELMGETIEILVPERYRRKHNVYRMNYQSRRNRRPMGAGRELSGLRKDGTEFPVEIGLNPIDGQHGRLIMATINDITERKQHESRIEQKNEALQRLNNELKEFAYSASHDLKAPLSSISGLLEFCESDLEAGSYDEVKTNLETARHLAVRLAGRIEDMLTLAQSDNLNGGWESVVLSDAVAEIWQILMGNGQPPVTLTTDLHHSEPVITVPARLYIVLENILSNAIKYQDKSKPEPSVHIESWDEEGTIGLSIRDNGIGIPAAYHDRIFELCKRVADTDEPGSGLGLALVKKNLGYLGGSIAVESTDAGTVFRLTLPKPEAVALPHDQQPHLEVTE